jgi:hypothetical protein
MGRFDIDRTKFEPEANPFVGNKNGQEIGASREDE